MTPDQRHAAPTTARRPDAEHRPLVGVLHETLRYARERDYTGWDYGDGMSSRIRRALPVENRWVNLAFQETAKRAPVNLRPLLLVEQRRNFKGTGLFAMANLNCDELSRAVDVGEPGVDYRAEAADLTDWLVDERIEGYSGFCGGHRHEIQHLHTTGSPDDPDVVSTSYAVQALLAAGRLDDRYPEVARSAADFVLEDLNYREVDDGARIDYHMNHDDDVFTVNAGALGARLLVDLYAAFGDGDLRRRATRILDHVANLQTPVGGWYYRDPPDSSHLSMDNHHNGFVIEAFLRHRAVTGSNRYEDTLSDALSFYREALFEESGAPNFDEANAYPRDIHASTQGALVFTYAGEFGFAERILEWAVENFRAGEGRFYFRKHRYHTKRHVLMRWCQAWMAYAISEYLTAVSGTQATRDAAIR
jgi:hypothetical protein